MRKYAMYAVVFVGLGVAITAALFAQHYKTEYEKVNHDKKMLIVQNVQLTKEAREAEADAFRMGVITCTNEDVAWFNEQADYYTQLAGANPLSKLMREWAKTWAYDDNELDEMVETYMNGDTN